MTPDVCIVGAGPAGISAARTFRSAGARVVLLDRHMAPGGKACGGGLTKEAQVAIGNASNAYPAYSTLDVHSPAGRVLVQTGEPFMAMAHREGWTRDAIDELVAKGVDVRLGTRVLGLTSNGVATSQGKIQAGMVVGADGPKSVVRRSLGLFSAVDVIARQIIVDHSNPGFAALFEQAPSVWFDYDKFGPGYGWAFPVEGVLKVGCGVCVRTHSAGDLKSAFFQWLSEIGVDATVGKLQTGSIGCNYAGHRFGNVFLAGDAAGFANPITGEGIGQAFVSGAEVAKEALDPTYRSEALVSLVVPNRRVLEMLLHPVAGRLLYNNMGLLLKSKWLAAKAMNRFI